MINIQIPEIFIPGFSLLANTSKDEAVAIGAFLKSIPKGTGNKTFEGLFNSSFSKFEDSNLAATIYSLASFKSSDLQDETSKSLASIISNAYKEQLEDGDQESIERLSENLEILFNNLENLYDTIKAIRLLYEGGRVYKSAKVVSDIRLVFNDEIEAANRAGLVIHNLKFTVEENNENKEYYFSLDTTDLIKLKECIERAEQKDKLIREQYAGSISFITISE